MPVARTRRPNARSGAGCIRPWPQPASLHPSEVAAACVGGRGHVRLPVVASVGEEEERRAAGEEKGTDEGEERESGRVLQAHERMPVRAMGIHWPHGFHRSCDRVARVTVNWPWRKRRKKTACRQRRHRWRRGPCRVEASKTMSVQKEPRRSFVAKYPCALWLCRRESTCDSKCAEKKRRKQKDYRDDRLACAQGRCRRECVKKGWLKACGVAFLLGRQKNWDRGGAREQTFK